MILLRNYLYSERVSGSAETLDGFFTSYPANVFLLKNDWKEKMG